MSPPKEWHATNTPAQPLSADEIRKLIERIKQRLPFTWRIRRPPIV